MKAEDIVIKQISDAFPDRKHLNESWIVENPSFLETVGVEEAKRYLPEMMIHVLKQMRKPAFDVVYMELLDKFTQYSKCKNRDDWYEGLKHNLSPEENKAVMSFLKHMRYNQPTNLDEEALDKILRRWVLA